jgi:hypothetical protein
LFTTTQVVTGGGAVKDVAALLAAIDDAAGDPAAHDRLLEVLVGITTVFSSAALFKGYAGGALVITSSRGLGAREARSWMRWPLRRLFIRMRPCRLLDPCGSPRQALAIPFARGDRRWIVIAPLQPSTRPSEYEMFLRAVESITVPSDTSESPGDLFVRSNDFEPAIVNFALAEDLDRRVVDALSSRGWPHERITSFTMLTRRLRHSVPDVVVVDVARLQDPVSAIASIHRIADCGALLVLAFHPAGFERQCFQAVVDRFLPSDASPASIFKSIKGLAGEAAILQRNYTRDERTVIRRSVAGKLGYRELAEFAAKEASAMVRGWASCFLLNDGGAVYRAECPSSPQPVLRTIPKTFLTGASIFEAVSTPGFIEELTDDPADRRALLAMRPPSCASVTLISDDGRHRGVLVACSIEETVKSRAFDALECLSEIVAQRALELQHTFQQIPEFSTGKCWESLRERRLTIEVYRSKGCVVPWRYRQFTDAHGLLTLNIHEDDPIFQKADGPLGRSSLAAISRNREKSAPFFAASIDFAAQSMNFATHGFSAPIFLNRSGPTSTIVAAGSVTTGTATLHSASDLVVCDSALWGWLSDQPAAMENLHTALDLEMPRGLASIITLD